MKKIVCTILSLMLVLSSVSALFVMPAVAADDITILVNDAPITFDQPPIIENGRTLVPFRAILEALGAKVDYNEYTEDDGTRVQTVMAEKGMHSVFMTIGETQYNVDFEEKTLDVPAKIVNDRTLVPIRAIAEGLDCAVDWDGDNRTVIVETCPGVYTVNEKRVTKEYKAADGTLLAKVDLTYPEIENPTNDATIAAWNEEYKKDIEEEISSIEEDMVPAAEEEKEWRDAEGYEVTPLEFEQTVDVTLNRKDLLSITEFYYYYTGGAHPNSSRRSRTFDMENKKELAISDILKDEDPNALMMKAYADMVDNNEYYAEDAQYREDLKRTIKESLDHVSFYLTDTGMELYFMPYDVASYAEGYIEATIPYKGNEDAFGVDLSGAKMDVFEFSLPGNPTTGYEWMIADSAPFHRRSSIELISIEESYQTEPGKENMPGAGGTYTYHVKGVKPGKVEFFMAYARSWEKEVPLEAWHYSLFVDSDLKITVISEGQVDPERLVKMSSISSFLRVGESPEGEKEDGLEIKLSGNPTTGFVWTVEEDAEGIVEIEENYASDSNDETLSGVGGTYTYRITGVTPGEVTLTFTYARPWESVEPWQTEQYTLEVGEDLKIIVIDHKSSTAE